ncbi:hypothetical protein MBLNU459_g6581t1 [Dothideomycetes sp. NU459]
MATRKRNEWLDADGSEDEEDQGYDSQDQEESRGALTGRSIKRRRVEQESDDESVDDEVDVIDDVKSKTKYPSQALDDAQSGDDMAATAADSDEERNIESIKSTSQTREPTVKPVTAKQLEKSQKAAKKTGVIYLSRIPPFMKPATLKHLLSPYGDIGRVFLTPEDDSQHKKRVRAGGNKKKSFADGWVEFLSKKDAKIVAESLNGNIIGGKKGNFYHDDLWNIKYLNGFKWHHLTDQIANENAERAARLRAEISKTRRENKKFVEDVERAKMLEGMQAKKKAQKERAGITVTGTAAVPPREDRDERKKHFTQNQVKLKTAKDGAKSEQPDAVKRVLSKIF